MGGGGVSILGRSVRILTYSSGIVDGVWVDGWRTRGAARRVLRDAVTRVMGVMCVHKNNNAAGGDRLRVHVEDVFVGVGAGGGRRGTRARGSARAAGLPNARDPS